MKVKLKYGMANPKGCFKRGAVLEVSDKEGKALVKGGYAELVPVEEKAAAPAAAPAPVLVADAPPVEQTAEAVVAAELEEAPAEEKSEPQEPKSE